jgi:ABC-type Fe3+-citrate transport system substrate-binding protein
VLHALGETKLDKKPERVVVLDSGNPWKAVPAVKAGKVVRVDDEF